MGWGGGGGGWDPSYGVIVPLDVPKTHNNVAIATILARLKSM
jgi:hypothetical protein